MSTKNKARKFTGEISRPEPAGASPVLNSAGRESCADCPLKGMRVAVVGGLARMLPTYRKIVSELGAQCIFHNGKVGNGSCKLKNVVCGSDLVVFITSINSHCALSVVKTACRKNRKRFIALRETGSESLGRLLSGCA